MTFIRERFRRGMRIAEAPDYQGLSAIFMLRLLVDLLLLGSGQALALNYTVTDLGTLGGAYAGAVAINDAGQVAGDAETANGEFHSFLYQNGSMTDLGTLGSGYSTTVAINKAGQVVGYSYVGDSADLHAFLYQNGGMIDLGTLGGFNSYPFGINDVGQIVGESHGPVNSYMHAFLYQDGSMIDLGTLGGPNSYARAINNAGQVVGHSDVDNTTYKVHAFLYQNGSMVELVSSQSWATGINDAGQIVGCYDAGNDVYHPFLYQNGIMADLGSLVGNCTSAVINSAGQVVIESFEGDTYLYETYLYENGVMTSLGSAVSLDHHPVDNVISRGVLNNAGQLVGDYAGYPFLYQNGVMTNLSNFDSRILNAVAINNAGQIAAYGIGSSFILTPTVDSKNLGPPGYCPIGNPVNQGTGNKYQVDSDYAGSGLFPLAMQRYYNGDSRVANSALGANWRSQFDRSIAAGGATATVYRPDGKVFTFRQSGGAWSGDADLTDRLQQTASGWTYTTSDDSVESYDTAGRLLAIANRAGLTQTLTYGASNRLQSVADPNGRQLAFGYDTQGRVQTMTDPAGGLYTYGYDANNNLQSVTYPDTHTRTYVYNEAEHTGGANLPHALTGITDENNVRYATWNYDARVRAISSEHAAGGVDKYSLSYTSDSNGNPLNSTVTDPLNTQRTYNFTTILGVVKSTGQSQPGGSGCGPASSAMTYDANGNVASRTDFNGVTTSYAYDMSRNIETSRTEASGMALARTITTTWHPTFRLPIQITEPGRATNYSYDAATGNLLTKTLTDSVSGTTRTWTYAYTTAADGTLPNLLKTVDGPRTDVSDVTTYAYYPNGDLHTLTNALGHVTQITQYDPNGRPTTLVDPNGLTTTLSYTPRGWLATRTVGSETTRYAYDGVGQLTQVTLPDSSSIAYTHDAAHRLTDITDALGNRIHYTLDNIGNRVQENVYDNLNNLTQTKSRTFDTLNRLWKEIGALNQTTLYTYDPNGNLTSITDPLGHTTVDSYDSLNRLTQATDAAGGITQYGYDPLDQLKRVTDPRNLVTNYTVNALGDQTQLNSPDTGMTNQSYDAAGNLATRTDARGIVTTYAYDALNRVTKISYSAASFPPIVFQYDTGPNALGKLSKMSDETGSTTWTYNAQGRIASQTQLVNGINQSLSYGYDAAGRLTSLTYPSGKVVSYSYDAQGRISSISVNGTPLLSNITYQAFGQAKAWTWGNGQVYARSFDQDGRMTSYPLGANLRALSFDPAARISGITDTIPAANQILGYDNLDRLTSWVAPATNQSYAYDANGNRQSLTIGASPYGYTVSAASNRLLTVAGPIAKTYSYDPAGHITGNGTRNYLYEPAGFMYASLPSTSPNPDVVFWHNGLGQRLIKTAAGASTLYAYDSNAHLLGEYAGSGAALQETVYLGDQAIGVMQGGALYYIYADHLNTPRVITNTSNTAVWRWDSDPFGTDAANQNPSGLGTFVYNLRFPGQYYDQETNLHYNYFRDYDPSTGRYVQSDPIGLEGGSFSTYAYVQANPLALADPAGLYQCTYAIGTHTMICTPNDPSHPPFSSNQYVSGNNQSSSCNNCQNNLNQTGVSNHGPLPVGTYSIGKQRPGSSRRNLTPSPTNQMADRSAFQIHGCSNPATCSNGCIAATTNRTRDDLNRLLHLEEGQNTLNVTP